MRLLRSPYELDASGTLDRKLIAVLLLVGDTMVKEIVVFLDLGGLARQRISFPGTNRMWACQIPLPIIQAGRHRRKTGSKSIRSAQRTALPQ